MCLLLRVDCLSVPPFCHCLAVCAIFFFSPHTGDAAHSLATRVAHILTAAFPQLAALFPGGRSGGADGADNVEFFRAGRARLLLDETRPPSAAAAVAAQRAHSAAERAAQVRRRKQYRVHSCMINHLAHI